MDKHYLDIDYGNMCFYEYSDKEKAGFEEHTNAAGKVSYRKLYRKGVYGILQSVSIVDTKFKGKVLSFRMLLGDDLFLASFSLYDQRGNIDNRFVEPLIALLPNMKKEQAYRIFPWSMESDIPKADGSPRMVYGVSVKEANLDDLTVGEGNEGKVLPKFVRCKKDEKFDASKHIPQLEFKEKLGSWKPTAVSVEAKQDFLIDLLESSLKTLGYEENDQNSKPEQEVKQKAKKKTPVKAEVATADDISAPTEDLGEEDYDDLPF